MYQLIPAPFMGAGESAGDGTIGSIAADRAWKVTSNAYDGAIVLMHRFQGNDETVEALKTILPELKAQGYQFVTLTELFTLSGNPIHDAIPGVKITDNKSLK
jgi:peptidoglycan/xylan/chitin deacetylase (PgdA/CDA1 family)